MESRKDFELCSPFVNVGQGSHLERVILSGICQHHGTMMCTRHGSYITHYITYTAIPLAGQFATQLAKKRLEIEVEVVIQTHTLDINNVYPPFVEKEKNLKETSMTFGGSKCS